MVSFDFLLDFIVNPIIFLVPCYLASMVLCLSQVCFVAIGFYFHTIWSEKMLDMISVFLNLLRLVLCPNIGL